MTPWLNLAEEVQARTTVLMGAGPDSCAGGDAGLGVTLVPFCDGTFLAGSAGR